MNPRLPIAVFVAVACVATSSARARTTQPAATRPAGDAIAGAAMRLLRQECLGCHNAEKHKGGLLLTSREAVLKGGESGPAAVAGRSAESRLIASLVAGADPHMPPKSQLAAADVAALAAWVDAGLPWDAGALSATAATRPIVLRELPATYAPVLAIALSPDGKTLAVGRGRKVYLHDAAKPDGTPAHVLDGLKDAVQSLAWSPDGKRLAAGDFGRALVWDAADFAGSPKVLDGLAGRVTALLFLPDNGTLIAADGGAAAPARLLVYQLPDVTPRTVVPAAHADVIAAIARTADGKLLATAGGDKVVRLWDPADLKQPVGTLEGHTGRVSAVTFAADSKSLASASADRDLKVWDVKTRERTQSVGPHQSALTALAWTGPKQIAVACEDGTVRLASTEAKEPGRPLPGSADDVLYCLALSADGKTLYAGCHDGKVYAFKR
ncbi:MAG TPA: c-type cytochrome domain-containing protein [Humisphaera sp.]